MALTLSLSILEQNDSKALVFTDTTSNWGVGGNPNISDIPNIYHLYLYLSITTSNNIKVDYNKIDLYALKNFTIQNDMVFTITPSLLKTSKGSQFNIDDLIPDGIVDVKYELSLNANQSLIDQTYTIFTYNQIKTKVYTRLRNIYPIYLSYDSRSKEISDSLLMYSFIKSMEASAYVALESELLNILDATEKIYINGSTYTWQ